MENAVFIKYLLAYEQGQSSDLPVESLQVEREAFRPRASRHELAESLVEMSQGRGALDRLSNPCALGLINQTPLKPRFIENID